MKVSAQYAQEHFADILTAIDTGEEPRPTLALNRPQPSEPCLTPRKRGRDEVDYAWNARSRPLTDEESRATDQELENEMINGPIFPLNLSCDAHAILYTFLLESSEGSLVADGFNAAATPRTPRSNFA
jgi:hypothetical protein